MRASPPDAPIDIAALAGRRVALWGWGREGRAAHAALRGSAIHAATAGAGSRSAHARFEGPLTLFCSAAESRDAAALADPALAIETDASAERLSAFDVVVKSPGISPYRPEALAAAARGTRFVGGTGLWFAQRRDARTLCVTGTKGKSTTTALLAHLLRAGGQRTALCGNIGLPLLELLDAQADWWAIELSSYQTRDVADSGVRPHLAVVTNLFPEHLDWHGSHARYVEDKLALLTDARPRLAVLNADDPTLASLALPDSDVRWYGRDDGWHLREDMLHRGDDKVLDTRLVPLAGRHNRSNLCAVLTALDAIGLDAAALAARAETFAPLPNRLQVLGVRDGLLWVNDSISTTPHASLAALEVFEGRRVALLAGGHDRGLEWASFADAMRTRPPAAIVTMGQNGPRIHALLERARREGALAAGARGSTFALEAAADLPDAVARARRLLDGDGVVLLSPGAPSFGAYRDYVERGRHFAQLAGFDPARISAIAGLGID